MTREGGTWQWWQLCGNQTRMGEDDLLARLLALNLQRAANPS